MTCFDKSKLPRFGLPRILPDREPDHRQCTGRLLPVPVETGLARDDLLPGLVAAGALELLHRHRRGYCRDPHPDLVGVAHKFLIPARVESRAAVGRDNEPGVVAVREPGNRGHTLLTALGTDGGEVEQVHAHESVTGRMVDLDHDILRESHGTTLPDVKGYHQAWKWCTGPWPVPTSSRTAA